MARVRVQARAVGEEQQQSMRVLQLRHGIENSML